MVLKYLRPVVHACRRRKFNAKKLFESMQLLDESAFELAFGDTFIQLMNRSFSSPEPLASMNTFCDQLQLFYMNNVLIWMIRGAKAMGDHNLAYFIQSRIDEIYESIDDENRKDMEELMVSLADVRIQERPANYSDAGAVSEIIRPAMEGPPSVDDYFARPEDEKRLQDAVKKMFGNGRNRRGCIFVTGEGGIGKTSLIAESIYNNDDFLYSCGAEAIIWLNVFKYSHEENGDTRMKDEVRSLLQQTAKNGAKPRVLLILDDVFCQKIFSAARRFDLFVIAISRRNDVVDAANFGGDTVKIERLTDSCVKVMFAMLNEKRSLPLPDELLCRLVELCSGLPLVVRIIMGKFIFREETEQDLEAAYEKLRKSIPDSFVDDKWSDEEKTVATISNLLLLGFEDETPEFKQRYSAFLMFEEASNVALRDLAILWQCSDYEALEQGNEFRDRSLVRVTNVADGMERRFNIHAYLYASLFRFTVTKADDHEEKYTERLRFRENVIQQTNKINKENALQQAIKQRRLVLLSGVILKILLNPECDINIFWETCNHRANEREADSTSLHYLLTIELFDDDGSGVSLPILCNIVNKMLAANRDLAVELMSLEAPILATMLCSVCDGAEWYKNALLTAARNSNLQLIDLLIDNGANINTVDDFGCNCLVKAAEVGSSDTTRKLLERGGRQLLVDTKSQNGKTALIVAAGGGSNTRLPDDSKFTHRIHSTLVNNFFYIMMQFMTASMHVWGTQNDHRNVVQLLLEHNADVEARDNDGSSPLMFASAYGHCDIAKILLENNADVNARNNNGRSPLMLAAASFSLDTVRLLLQTADIEVRDNNGWSPLMFAAANSNVEICKLLLDENKCDVTARNDNGQTALMLASAIPVGMMVEGMKETYNALRTLELMLLDVDVGSKADIQARADRGLSPFMEATKQQQCDVVKQLLEHKSDIEAQDNDGFSPLMRASMRGHYDVVKLLLEEGADVNFEQNRGASALMCAAA